jgi:hypothetical protein
LFGLSGGTGTQLACEITGAALSNQSALVVNAHVASTTIAGANDTTTNPTTPPPTDTPADPNTPTTPAGSVNTQAGQGRNLDDSTNPRRNRTNNTSQGGSSLSPTQLGGGPRPASSVPAPRPAQGFAGNQGQPAPQPQPAGGGAAPVPSGGGVSGNAADGSMKATKGEPAPDKGTVSDTKLDVTEAPAPLVVTPGLHFCDRNFKVLGAVVLDKTVSGEAGGRVWIVLKRAKDKDPSKAETVTVTLKVCGVARELVLTETGKDTGEFRCSKEGVLLLTAENPDSNKEVGPAEPPKIRLPR